MLGQRNPIKKKQLLKRWLIDKNQVTPEYYNEIRYAN